MKGKRTTIFYKYTKKKYQEYHDFYIQDSLTDINIEYASAQGLRTFYNLFSVLVGLTALFPSVDKGIYNKLGQLTGFSNFSIQLFTVVCWMLLLTYTFFSIAKIVFKISVLEDLRQLKIKENDYIHDESEKSFLIKINELK